MGVNNIKIEAWLSKYFDEWNSFKYNTFSFLYNNSNYVLKELCKLRSLRLYEQNWYECHIKLVINNLWRLKRQNATLFNEKVLQK